jgi:hypothetical protein
MSGEVNKPKQKRNKRSYFPNNVRAISAAPAEFFEPIGFQEFFEWRVGGWEIPSSVMCIIREQSVTTGKVKEHIYKQKSAAERKIRELMHQEDTELTIATEDAVHYIKYKDETDDD